MGWTWWLLAPVAVLVILDPVGMLLYVAWIAAWLWIAFKVLGTKG